MKEKNIITNNIIEKNLALLLLLIIAAYLFSMGVRMYWPLHFADAGSMYYAGELMINTNDGYFFSTGARDVIDGVVAVDSQRASAYNVSPGLVLLTAYLTKLTPFSLDTVSLYLPGIISSLIVIPIILTARLVGNTLLGFLAALIGSIAWSYYNRTMIGYYDTDMFSVLLQFVIFYSFMKIIYEKTIFSVIIASFWVLIYPLFYSQGLTITYTMFMILALYMFLEHINIIKSDETKNFKKNALSFYATVTLVSIALMVSVPIELRAILLIVLSIILLKKEIEEEYLTIVAIISFLGFLYFGNIFIVIWDKVFAYADRGLDEGALQFYQVIQTVREAGAIPFETMANRISGSELGLVLSVMGYLLLLVRHKAFIVALPLIGIGVFSLVGGLRFTVYAVPIAALSVVYLFFILGDLLAKNMENQKFKNPLKYLFIVSATIGILSPNIKHIEAYLVPTVLNKTEVNDLVQLDKIASNKDYTLTWWDYGYPIWYYSNTNTLIDGGKHTHDNYIISKLLFSTSPQQVANLSKLAVETYVESDYAIVADQIFKDKNPKTLLNSLTKKDYVLPKKTREVYLYMPYRMLNIFPTVGVFGNLNLKTGRKARNIIFYPTVAINQSGTQTVFQNGIVFDSSKGTIQLGKKVQKAYRFDQVKLGKNASPIVNSSLMHLDGQLCVVNLQSYNKVIIMDRETYNSAYVQMFMLGNYDKNLFEVVVSSAYSKIYRVK
jgi:dolichyl-diphosphooligosaccharide--protein glycosyltransferase/undecaprenyl-diphosphooligosaccharide--protein glycosyltransferase